MQAQEVIPALGGGAGSGGTEPGGAGGSQAEGSEQSGSGASGTTETVPALPATPKGEDGTLIGRGAAVSVAETAIENAVSDEGPSGSKFGLLQLQMKKAAKSSITIRWKKIAGAKYIVYGNKCGRKNKFKKIIETTAVSYTQKKLKKGTYYKYLVVAVKNGKVVTASKVIHVATSGKSVGNHTKVKVNKKKLSLKKGAKAKLKAKVYTGKKKVRNHRKIYWESSDPGVATVKNGKVTAKAKGTAVIDACAQNGKFAKCVVKVL